MNSELVGLYLKTGEVHSPMRSYVREEKPADALKSITYFFAQRVSSLGRIKEVQ